MKQDYLLINKMLKEIYYDVRKKMNMRIIDKNDQLRAYADEQQLVTI